MSILEFNCLWNVLELNSKRKMNVAQVGLCCEGTHKYTHPKWIDLWFTETCESSRNICLLYNSRE